MLILFITYNSQLFTAGQHFLLYHVLSFGISNLQVIFALGLDFVKLVYVIETLEIDYNTTAFS